MSLPFVQPKTTASVMSAFTTALKKLDVVAASNIEIADLKEAAAARSLAEAEAARSEASKAQRVRAKLSDMLEAA